MGNLERRIPVTQKNTLTVGDRLRLTRMGSNLNVKELAGLLGISPVSVYERENGNGAIREGYVPFVERTLGISAGTLMQNKCDIKGTGEVFNFEIPEGRAFSYSAVRIAEIIFERIKNGSYTHKLPTNLSFAEEFGSSRETVAQAVKKLRAEGIIIGNKRGGKTSVEG